MGDDVAYNVGAGVECLVLAAILALVVGPVRQLNCGVGARGGGAGERGDLVALVAWLDLCDILDDLLSELALGGGLFMRLSVYKTLSTRADAKGIFGQTIVKGDVERNLVGIVSNRQGYLALA